MFNLSFSELILLGVIGLIVIGPKQLPNVAKTIAKTINEFKRALNEASNSVTKEIKAEKELDHSEEEKKNV